jgi:hypothetical protein
MHNQAKQANIPTPAGLADGLIGSLSGLTAIEGDELRCQIVMLINHSYALGYAAGADAGLVARMRSRIERASRRARQDIKLALSAIRERLAMIFRDHRGRSHQMFPPTFAIQFPMRGSAVTGAIPIRCFHSNRPAEMRRQTPVITDALPIRCFHGGLSGANTRNNCSVVLRVAARGQVRRIYG